MFSGVLFRLSALSLLFLISDLTAQPVPKQLTLETARILLMQNPALQAQRIQVEVEKSDVIDTEKYSNPELEFTADGVVFDSERGSFINRLQPSFLFRQEIITAGKREKRTRVEAADAEIAEIEVADLQRILTYELKQAYFQVVLVQEDLRLSREILDQFKSVVRLNRIRFEKGELSGGELRRIEAAQYQFHEDVITTEVQLQNAKIRLLATIGVTNLDQDFEAVDPFDPKFVPPPLVELEVIALKERPDLAIQKARVIQSESTIELEKALNVPNIVPFGGYKRELDVGGPVIGVSIPLFIFNRNEGRISRAEAEKRKREKQSQLKLIRVSEHVRLAKTQLDGNRRRIEALENEYLLKASQSRTITESAYRLGATSLLDYLDAERTYREMSRRYNRVLFDFQVSRASLELAIGDDL